MLFFCKKRGKRDRYMKVIGIVCTELNVDKNGYKQKVNLVANSYIEMLTQNDAVPILISPQTEKQKIKEIVEILDGLLFIGGEDIKQGYYDNELMIKEISKRDELEIELYKECKEKKIPILGICRGLQIINVAEGGTLENISPKSSIKHTIDEDGFINYHDIYIEKDSNLKKIMKVDNYSVCSMHHQKIAKLGNNLKISAKSEDGVIEAIESNDKNFVLAFQGHIEKNIKNFKKYNNVIKEFLNNTPSENYNK